MYFFIEHENLLFLVPIYKGTWDSLSTYILLYNRTV